MKQISRDTVETKKIAADFAEQIQKQLDEGRGVLILMEGDFGAGKTTFVQGLAEALGVGEKVVSPSYVYIREYEIKHRSKNKKHKYSGSETDSFSAKLIHIDAWRVKRVEDLELIGYLDYLVSGNVVVVEWGGILINHKTKNIKQKLGGKAEKVSEIKEYTVSLLELEDGEREIEIAEVS